jgi:hypothetical protein
MEQRHRREREERRRVELAVQRVQAKGKRTRKAMVRAGMMSSYGLIEV